MRPLERAVAWTVGIPFASWRYVARDVVVRRNEGSCPWPVDGFADQGCTYAGDPETLQRASAGCGAAFRRRYRVRIAGSLLAASELMAIIRNDPNVACPLEIARFERDDRCGESVDVGEEMRVRLPGPWNGPVRVVDVTELSFRLATLRGHMEAGEIEFRARDESDHLVFEIESWARSNDRVFDFLYARLGIASELQLDMWAYFLERVAQVSGGVPDGGLDVDTLRCDDHPL
jgi:hypothetical protein